jgi:phospholipid/cholesterol/gamma-HCH transport system permease protein
VPFVLHEGRPYAGCGNAAKVCGVDRAIAHQEPDAPFMPAQVRLSVTEQSGEVVLAVSGRLDAQGAGAIWNATLHAGTAARGRSLAIDLSGASFCDLDGATLLAAAEAAHGKPATLHGATERVTALLARARNGLAAPVAPAPPSRAGLRETLAAGVASVANAIAFLGETVIALTHLPRHRRMFRVPDLLLYALQSGARSLPLAILLGYLMGLILAFQSAVPMRRFGADLFVIDLVTIALVRELGPLLAAVILSGRTGSAFAAEIGTMKVNEEVDALATMGIDPTTNLVLPRIAAVMLTMPVVTLVLELAGLLGMATVMRAFGFPMVTIVHQAQGAADLTDLLGGLGKSMAFGLAVAAIGCRAGLSTGVGPRAVGLAATAAVVGGIVSTIALDGVFALLFYRLGW